MNRFRFFIVSKIHNRSQLLHNTDEGSKIPAEFSNLFLEAILKYGENRKP